VCIAFPARRRCIRKQGMDVMVVKGVKADMSVKLLVVQGRPLGKSLLFPVGEYYFGRGPECHVRPDSEWVSRQHCLLRVTHDKVYVRYLGSRNGTLVNGALLEYERQLSHGDQVQVGPLVFEVNLEMIATPEEADVGATDAVTLGGENTTEMETTPGGPSILQPGVGVNDPTSTHPSLPAKEIPPTQPPSKSDPPK